ncbi:MAG TPA: Stp1/IreP family PP2C-type Ser/Thr phosphatase [Thermodesulfobacteriota bacterium]|nr:Stp1/IreP family PP2C-type Ser/Thr phosphatase [Thermodesulfobacteriota bacterium]
MEAKNKSLEMCSLSDIGKKRENNEDSFLYAEIERKNGGQAYLLAVADGMGGHLCGEVASRYVVDILREFFISNLIGDNIPLLLKRAITDANRFIHDMSCKTPEFRGMGSTCTALVCAEGKAYIAHVGDSRAYLVRRGDVRKITKDHTIAERMVESGMITVEEAKVCPERNALLRAVGPCDEVEVDLMPAIEMMPGDILVLCSDGLTEFVEEDEIGSVVTLFPPSKACDMLVNIANKRGGTDNITVQVIRILANLKKPSLILSGVKNLFTLARS